MWVWALRGSRYFEPMSYSVQLHWPHRGELIIVSLGNRLYTMHKATCGIHADMRLVSDTPGFPFLGLVRFKGYVRGPCSSLSFKAQVKVASTIDLCQYFGHKNLRSLSYIGW